MCGFLTGANFRIGAIKLLGTQDVTETGSDSALEAYRAPGGEAKAASAPGPQGGCRDREGRWWGGVGAEEEPC